MSYGELLKADLISAMPIEQVFQKHIVDGKSYFFDKELNNKDLEYELRDDLARSLSISINEVIIVGSAKIGFSVKSHKFRPFDYDFTTTKNPRKRSDIDIAIINKHIFDKICEEIFHLSRHFDERWIEQNWAKNYYYPHGDDLYYKYVKYLSKGWLRPDYFPTLYLASRAWKDECEKWHTKTKKRKISIGIYSSWVYFKHYQMDNLEKLKTKFYTLDTE